jgi:Ca-activated chloride channel homolog
MNFKSIPALLEKALDKLSLPSLSRNNSLPNIGERLDTVLVLDISTSMGRDDYAPCRLAAAQDAADDLLNNRIASGVESRVAIAAFNDVGLPICPLTVLTQVMKLKKAIRELTPKGDTNIGAGLAVAEHYFNMYRGPSVKREVVLLTDGRNNKGSDPEVAAARLKQMGCEIRTIGIGGSPDAVDELLLRSISTADPFGKPHYRFITNRDGLLRHFAQIGGLTR